MRSERQIVIQVIVRRDTQLANDGDHHTLTEVLGGELSPLSNVPLYFRIHVLCYGNMQSNIPKQAYIFISPYIRMSSSNWFSKNL